MKKKEKEKYVEQIKIKKRVNKNKKKNKTMKGGNLAGKILHSVQNITKPLMNNPEPVIGGQRKSNKSDPTKGHMVSKSTSR